MTCAKADEQKINYLQSSSFLLLFPHKNINVLPVQKLCPKVKEIERQKYWKHSKDLLASYKQTRKPLDLMPLLHNQWQHVHFLYNMRRAFMALSSIPKAPQTLSCTDVSQPMAMCSTSLGKVKDMILSPLL